MPNNLTPLSEYYLYMSALQKAIRWCEVNDARYFARKLVEMGKPGAVFNRLLVIAAEDIGLADPTLIHFVIGCMDRFNDLLKEKAVKKSETINFPEGLDIIDAAVIASAVSYKSRLLQMMSFATLYSIYKNKDFKLELSDYLKRFESSIKKQDEKEAVYCAYVAVVFLKAEDPIFEIIQRQSHRRNKILIKIWIEAYKKTKGEFLILCGIVALLCRDLDFNHGEFIRLIDQHTSQPINEAEIPDRAYDQHTHIGKRKGRGLKHFFDEAGTIRNERFPNEWEEPGKKAYLDAEKVRLAKEHELIEKIFDNNRHQLKMHFQESE